MLNIILVGTGGFTGAVLRYLVSGWAQKISGSGFFPFGTMAVNIAGCLVIGILGGFADNIEIFSPSVRLFVFIGVLGGFTTFSTFGYETMALLRDREIFFALANVVLSVVLGLAFVWLGYAISNIKGG